MAAATVFGGLFLTGVAVSAASKYEAGKAAKKAHDYNADVAEKRGVYAETQSRLKWKRLIGQQLALYAKAGVDVSSGYPLLVMSQQAAEGELEALNIRYGSQNVADIERYYGKQAKGAGRIGAVSTLLTGLGAFGAMSGGGGGSTTSGTKPISFSSSSKPRLAGY